MIDDPRLARLAKLLKRHPWGYEYSKDNLRMSVGAASMLMIEEEMNSLRQEGRGDDADDLWEEHCPWSTRNRSKT